jgi:hypothetical protein
MQPSTDRVHARHAGRDDISVLEHFLEYHRPGFRNCPGSKAGKRATDRASVLGGDSARQTDHRDEQCDERSVHLALLSEGFAMNDGRSMVV